MEKVLKQAPIGICDEKIKEIFDNNNGDINKTLMELWDIPLEIEKEKTKWDDIRETCDAFDEEMSKMMKSKKNDIDNK